MSEKRDDYDNIILYNIYRIYLSTLMDSQSDTYLVYVLFHYTAYLYSTRLFCHTPQVFFHCMHHNYTLYCILYTLHNYASFLSHYTGGAINIAGVTVGMLVVIILLTLLSLTAGVAVGVVLKRRGQGEKRKLPENKTEFQEMSNIIEVSETAPQLSHPQHHLEEEEGTKDHTYDVVDEESTTVGREAVYQSLDVSTQDYVSVYNQLGGGTYQELDTQGKEEEHHYQAMDVGKEGH